MSPFAPAVRRGRALAGSFRPPGDKSITHRAVLFALLADGNSVIVSPNTGEDCRRSLDAACALGARVVHAPDWWGIIGTDGRPGRSKAVIDCGNSGTTMRLLAGILAGQDFRSELVGDASLSRRPMARVIEPLLQMGAVIKSAKGGLPPLRLRPADLRAITYELPVASAQVATCLLLAGLRAPGRTSVQLPGPARDHTERMLPAFGVALDIVPAGAGRRVSLKGGSELTACTVRVPGDASAAAFFLAAAAAEPGGSVTAEGMNLNPTRTGLLDVLAEMGATVSVENVRDEAGEPVADVTVRGPERLRAFDVPPEWVPRLIDEVPAWVIAASAAEGVSRVTGAAELRVKESDRVAVLVSNLSSVGISARELPDGLEVEGGSVRGGHIEAHLDHRIVMAFAALGARAASPITFDDVTSVATSYPAFFETLASLGVSVEPVDA